jgi:DNA polymerase III sliding clamp (beta) subunit (PCNA family)
MQFKWLFQTLKDLLFDCNIHFDEHGMKISELDRSQVGLVHARLPKDSFPIYNLHHPIMLGVSITSLHKYLGHITQGDHTRSMERLSTVSSTFRQTSFSVTAVRMRLLGT